MINFLRFDLQKMLGMPAFYIYFILMFALAAVLGPLLYNGDQSYQDYYDNYQQFQQSQDAKDEEGNNFEFTLNRYEESLPLMDEDSFQTYQKELNESYRFDQITYQFMMTMMDFSIIFFAIFVCNDFSSGYFKNLLSLSGCRWKWVLSKVGLALVFGLIALVFAVISGAINHGISIQPSFSIHWARLFTHFAIMQVGLVIAMLLVSLIILLIQNRTLTILIATLIAMRIQATVLIYLSQKTKLDFSSLSYVLTAEDLGFGLEGSVSHLFLLGMTYILVLLALSLLRSRKMDFQFSH